MTDNFNLSPSPRLSKALAICLIALLTACAEEDPKKFVQEGTALFDKGDFEAARVQFKNALQADPKLADAYYGMALLDEKKQDFTAARKNLAEAIAISPDNVEAHVKLGFMLFDQMEKAQEQAAIALKLDPEDVDAILLDGTLKFREKEYSVAMAQAERVLAKNPENSQAIWLKVSVLIGEQRYAEAQSQLDKGIQVHTSELGLDLLQVRLHKAQNLPNEVIRDYERLVKKYPEDETLRHARLEVLATLGTPEEVENALRDAIGKDPDDIGLKINLVDFVESLDPLKAESLLKEFIAADPKEVKLKGRLSGFYIGRNRIQDAQKLLNEIVTDDPRGKDGLTAKLRLAELAKAENDDATAENLIEELIKDDSANSGALLFRANLRLTRQNTDGAISDLRIVLRDKPDSDKAMVLMGQAYAIKGEKEVAESHWRKALETNPANLNALTSLVSALFGHQDAVRAEDLITKSLKASPDNPTMLELLVQARVAQKNWAGAEAAVSELKKQPKAEIAAQMLMGMLAASQGHHADAIQSYKDVLHQKPNSAEALVAMARSYESLGHRAEFLVFLKAFLIENPGNIDAYNTLGLAYAADKNWTDASKTLQLALQQNPKSTTTYTLLAGVLIQQNKAGEVPQLFQTGLEASPGNFELMLNLAKFYESIKDYAAAITTYENLLKIYPNSDDVVNNLGYLLTEFGGSADSLRRSVVLTERFKDSVNPYFQDTYGWTLFKSGNANAAIDAFKKAVARVPANAEFHYHLGEAYFAAGDKTAAKLELEKSLSAAGKESEFAGIGRAKELLKQAAG